MKADTYLPVDEHHLPTVGEIARAADEIGFDGLWTNETKHDGFLPLVLAAEHSSRLQLGTSIAIAFSRSPMVVAQLAWDLQHFANGRLILGLGTQVKGHVERRFGMPWSAPVPRMRDYIGALRAIWRSFQTGERLDYRSEHYEHTLLMPFFNPGPIEHPEIPIHIAGVNAPLARLAGEICEGFHVHPFHTPRYLGEVVRPALEQGAARAGRSVDAVEVATSVFVIAGRTEAEVREQREFARSQLSFYGSTPTYRPVLAVHGWSEIGEQLSRLAAAREWNRMPSLISDEMLQAFTVEAAPDELGPAILARYDGLVDRIAPYRPFRPGEDDAFWKKLIRALHGQ